MPHGEPEFEVGKEFMRDLTKRLTETAKPCHQRIVAFSEIPALTSAGLIPNGYKIVAMSEHHWWDRNELAVKIEHPDFSPVQFPEPIPELKLPTTELKPEIEEDESHGEADV